MKLPQQTGDLDEGIWAKLKRLGGEQAQAAPASTPEPTQTIVDQDEWNKFQEGFRKGAK